MPKSKQRKPSDRAGATTPLLVLDVIDSCLKDMLRTFPQKELTPEEVTHWHTDLGNFPQEAIEWSFDNWRRNGRFFPVYGDIIDQCIAWDPSHKPNGVCDAECKKKHWTGYGENPARGYHDMTRLNELVRRKIDSEKRTREQPFTDEEIEGLLQQLDKMRGEVPAFRITA